MTQTTQTVWTPPAARAAVPAVVQLGRAATRKAGTGHAGDRRDEAGVLRDNSGGRLIEQPIEQELKDSYLTYAMSVIVSRALPDVRDGLKPSQRRILVAMNDLNLSPGASRVKCAKISGDTSGNYHPHGESVIYPTLVRMAQEWNMRHVLVDKQGNFGSIAGLPAAAMRYTEARLSPIAAMMLDDLELDTVDFVPTYDERNTEPVVLPSRFPNLVVNGAGGIAVGMATSIPPHNLGEVCRALVQLIDVPGTSMAELLQMVPGPDFPTGGIVMGRESLVRGYLTGRSTITLRARAHVEEFGKNRSRIVVTEIPYQQTRDAIEEKIAELVNDDRIKGISAIRNESDLKDPVRLILELKRDADPDVVLNQLYQFSPLQTSFSLIFLAARRWEAADAVVQAHAGGIPPPSHRCAPPPHAAPARPGPQPEAHGRRSARGAGEHRRGDQDHPQFEVTGRGEGAAGPDPDAGGRCWSGPSAPRGLPSCRRSGGPRRPTAFRRCRPMPSSGSRSGSW